MRNKLFQFTWYYIVRPLVPVDKNGPKPWNHEREFRAMMRLARLFGGAHGVIFGDSEIGQFDSYAVMSRFSRIVMNWGVGGTVAGEWHEFLRTTPDLLEYINRLRKVLSIGGNYSLRFMTDLAPRGMKCLHDLVRPSWIMLVPPVYTQALARLGKDEATWRSEMETIRGIQIDLWGKFIIDTYSPFVDAHGYPKPGVLEDMVHFSRRCVEIIQRFIDPVL